MGQVNPPVLAKHFGLLMMGVLALIILNVVALVFGGQLNAMPAVRIVLGLVGLAIIVFLIIQIVPTTNALGWGTAATVVCCILMFVPCISLITLLVINQAAVKALKAAGYKVGLMGAKT